MDRTQAMIDCIHDEISYQIKKNCNEIEKVFFDRKDILKCNLKALLDRLWDELPIDNRKKVKYLVSSALRTSVHTGSFDYRMSLHDHTLFVHTALSEVFWTPTISFDYGKADFPKIEMLIKKNFIRVMPHELTKLKRLLDHYYYIAVHLEIDKLITAMFHESSWTPPLLTENLAVLSGVMWGTMRPLYIKEKR